MCANMQPGAKCPLDGELLCRNDRPNASSTGAPTQTCTPRPAAAPQPQPVQWEPARSTLAADTPNPQPA